MNDRGYPRDGWKPPTPADKVKLITELAQTAIDPPDPVAIGSDGASVVVAASVDGGWREFVREGILHNLYAARKETHLVGMADQLDSIIKAVERRLGA